MTYENTAAVTQTLSYEGYNLKWQDDFSAATLNENDWNVELHDAGWVNQENRNMLILLIISI